VKFKIDENLSPSVATIFHAAGHDAHSVVQQALGGQSDSRIIDECSREQRALITLDLDFSNILTYPPAKYPGIVVFRVANQANVTIEAAARRVLSLLSRESLTGTLWIVEDRRIRIHG
jgi:predicted nuclease of predicted toxin-antitoxin system